jgi:very-short-patch-repair endonuclease
MAHHRRVTIRARALRKVMTPHEARLWIYLRTLRAEGYHFRRQVPLQGYFADFACLRSRLIVEADGGQHNDPDQADHDEIRDRALARVGFRVLRIPNDAIRYNPDGVAHYIRRALGVVDITGPLTPPASPPPRSGGGGRPQA